MRNRIRSLDRRENNYSYPLLCILILKKGISSCKYRDVESTRDIVLMLLRLCAGTP